MNSSGKIPIVMIALLLSSFQCQAKNKEPDYLSLIKLDQVSYINYLFTDINGTPKEVTYPASMAQSLEKDGFKFDGSSVQGITSIKESDMTAKPDMSTFALVPWYNYEQKIARVICDVYRDEYTPYEGDPRSVLKQALAQAEEMGFDFFVGPELEFFICNDEYKNRKSPIDQETYFADNHDAAICDLKISLFNALLIQGIPIEKIHHEVAPGQYEMSIKYSNALSMADHLIITKQTIRAIAKLAGYKVTFMPKPFFGQNGSGMHMHFSLWDRNNNCNAFYDKNGPAKLSKIGQHFIAGVLAHITELNVIFNPTVNSYKRLVPGYEAPINICWGAKNRSGMIRIPQVNDDQPYAVRAEIRSADPMTNPYLAFAALLQAGMDGIKNKMVLDAPVEDNLYHLTYEERETRGIKTLHRSLESAISLFSNSDFAKKILGECLVNEFVKSKQKEITGYNTFITNWELENYFEG